MKLDPIVQAAFVSIVAWLLNLAVNASGFPLNLEVVNAIAAGIVLYVLRYLGVDTLRALFPGAVERGLLSAKDEQK